jgi:hypothetical protein
VAAVEVSVDGGATWHRAAGRASWTYTGSFPTFGPASVRVRSVDDSGNLQTSPTVVPINVTCPCSIFGSTAVPSVPSADDTGAVTLGVKFTSDVAGWITAVRFYKGTGNSGTHVGSIWSTSGQLLSSATFTNESATGWQTVNLTTPVPVTAGTTYIASYFAPNGHYAGDGGYFATATGGPPLHALADGTSGGNGVYTYGGNLFPSSTFSASNYWVDVVLSTTAP